MEKRDSNRVMFYKQCSTFIYGYDYLTENNARYNKWLEKCSLPRSDFFKGSLRL